VTGAWRPWCERNRAERGVPSSESARRVASGRLFWKGVTLSLPSEPSHAHAARPRGGYGAEVPPRAHSGCHGATPPARVVGRFAPAHLPPSVSPRRGVGSHAAALKPARRRRGIDLRRRPSGDKSCRFRRCRRPASSWPGRRSAHQLAYTSARVSGGVGRDQMPRFVGRSRPRIESDSVRGRERVFEIRAVDLHSGGARLPRRRGDR
jgi:hypothetical protein